MKRASYREAVSLVAENDNDTTELDEVAGLLTTYLVACLFEVDCEKVAKDVIAYRKKHFE